MTVRLRGLRRGATPQVGDFVYLPQSASVGIVHHVPKTTPTDPAAISARKELRWLIKISQPLPLSANAYVIERHRIMSFMRCFIGEHVLVLPQLKANSDLRSAVVMLLNKPEGNFYDDRFTFKKIEDPQLQKQLRAAFTRAADDIFIIGPNEERIAQRGVAYTVVFNEELNRDE